MRLIEIDCLEITLTGITFNSTFAVRNPHEILAAMFQFQSRPDCFEIQPRRGMILQGEKKLIKIRLKPQYRSQAEKISQPTYYCEYNKKLLVKLIRHRKRMDCMDGAAFQSSLSRLSFQAEVEKLKESIRHGNSLKNSRRQNSFEKFRDSSVKRVKNSKLNEDLDFLFRNQEYAKLKANQQYQKKNVYKDYNRLSHFGQEHRATNNNENRSNNDRQQQQMYKRKESKAKIVSVKSIQSWKGNSIEARPNNSRGLQLIVLAIIAALFLAIGQGMGSLLK